MANVTTVHAGIGCKIPLLQIDANRRAFGRGRLSYQLELQSRDPLAGIEELARACRGAGLGLEALRCGGAGRMVCTLVETEAAELSRLADHLGRSAALRLDRWTTTIGF